MSAADLVWEAAWALGHAPTWLGHTLLHAGIGTLCWLWGAKVFGGDR